MQRTIGSFFTAVKSKPKTNGGDLQEMKKTETACSSSATENDQCSDSPIKRGKRIKRRIEDSSDEETESGDLSNGQHAGDECPTNAVSPAQRIIGTPPKRATARRRMKRPKIEIAAATEDNQIKKESCDTEKESNEAEIEIKSELTEFQDSANAEDMKEGNDGIDGKLTDPLDSAKAEDTKEVVLKAKTVGNSFFAPRKAKSPAQQTANEKTRTPSESPSKKQTNINVCANAEVTEGGVIDPAIFSPNKAGYDPVVDACWKNNDKVPYQALSRTFQIIEDLSARLKITATLCNFFRSVILLTPDDLLPCVYLCLNKVAPAFEGIELGIGETILMKVVASSTGKNLKQIKEMFAEQGDLGLVAEQCRTNQRMMMAPPKLSIRAVFAKLKEIAKMSGNTSMGKKQDKIQSMFVACRNSEARYLIRSLGGKLRIGLAEQTVLAALSHAVALTHKGTDECLTETQKKDSAALAIKTAYCELPNYDILVPNLLKVGWQDISKFCHLTPGVPLKPMLAHPSKGIAQVLSRFDLAAFSCEFKYDGERAQIHILENGDVNVYSRNQENNTSKYPDIVSRIPKVCKDGLTSCIIDTESVAWDKEKQQILPFQVLSTRKRKDADVSQIKVQVCVYAFDLLYLNGVSLVKEPFRKRRDLLRSSFEEIEGEFMLAKSIVTSDEDVIAEFLDESIKSNCEGLMVKTLDVHATYEIAKRSHNWLKLKKDYLEGVGDTLDLVVIGAFHGAGKRTGKYGGFLLACYDEENEEFQSICKMGTGFSDEQLAKQHEFLQQHLIDKPRSYYRYGDSVTPDHWFDAVQVWEVRAADLSISPTHKAAISIVDPEKGISLRFPRFLRIRDDKTPEEATNAQQVAEMYRSQEVVKNNADTKSSAAGDEDFY